MQANRWRTREKERDGYIEKGRRGARRGKEGRGEARRLDEGRGEARMERIEKKCERGENIRAPERERKPEGKGDQSSYE